MQTVDMEATARESEPFKSLQELYTNLNNLKPWPMIIELRESTEYVFRGSDIHLPRERLERVHRDSQPRTIICHDMKGGYIEDRFIDGCKAHDAYVFYHWSIVDTFIYFSHHFVTVPPYGWINAAHTHGVKILGTVITEHTKGAAIWDEILESKEAVHKFANALIRIAKFYKFEGWLLNVENTIKPEHINNLIHFVKYLTDNIHMEIDGSEIIWYDSVTNKGELKWQNELNNENKEFFLSCDGIFLNYNWTDSRLAGSQIFAKNLNRDVHDVYVGLDVWGRGCPGGGGFNSAYALDKIRKQNLSVAIFAPGWTHEYFGPETFCKLENTFWAQLLPYLDIHVPIYDNEKFQTSFCRGTGIAYYRNGEVQFEMQVNDGMTYFDKKCFYNLAMQQPQISVPSAKLKFISSAQYQQEEASVKQSETSNSTEPKEFIYENAREILRVCKNVVNIEAKPEISYSNDFELCDEFSYEGGGCLKLITRDITSYHRLFITHIDFECEIQASIIYAEGEITSIHNQPILVLGNQAGSAKIFPSQFWEINSRWKKCIYTTNFRAINEIGVMFLKEGDCYLGEIVLEQKQQQQRV